MEQPAFGQVRIANEVRKRGHSISPAGVRSVWPKLNSVFDKKNVDQ
jgi:hypothetical protein